MRLLQPAGGDVDLFRAYPHPDPSVRVNFVASIDGAATLDGRTEELSSPADKELFQVLRATSDVVLVGAGTARIEKYGPVLLTTQLRSWRKANRMTVVPPLAVVSATLDLNPASALFTEAAARTLILTGANSPAAARAALSQVADLLVGDSIADWLALLADRGLTRVLCEGGPQLFGALLADDRVDELCLTRSPLIAGGVAPRIAEPALQAARRRFDLVHVLEDDGYLFLRYRARRS